MLPYFWHMFCTWFFMLKVRTVFHGSFVCMNTTKFKQMLMADAKLIVGCLKSSIPIYNFLLLWKKTDSILWEHEKPFTKQESKFWYRFVEATLTIWKAEDPSTWAKKETLPQKDFRNMTLYVLRLRGDFITFDVRRGSLKRTLLFNVLCSWDFCSLSFRLFKSTLVYHVM